MKLLVVSLCTQGIMREHFIYYCRGFAKNNDLYCVTNDNVSNKDVNAIETLNLHYDRNNPLGYFSVKKLYTIKRFISRINPDIVYIFTHHASSILIAPMIKKYKIIYQVHDPAPHQGVGKLNGYILRLQLKMYSKIADRLIVAGEAVKKQVLQNSSATEEKIKSIPFAVLDDFIRDDIEPVDKQVDLLFFGRIEPYKGIDTLLDALEKMNDKPSTYIIGSGDIKQAYRNIKVIPENVHVLGFLETSELIEYIRACKVIVLPYHEATGTMTVCQSFYYGKPVIASDVGVLPEYVDNGGLIFKHGDSEQLSSCIRKLLYNRQLHNELSQNAKNMYQKRFTIDNACKMHQEVFESLVHV